MTGPTLINLRSTVGPQSPATYVPELDTEAGTVLNRGPATVYYNNTASFTPATALGSLASGASASLTSPYFLVETATSIDSPKYAQLYVTYVTTVTAGATASPFFNVKAADYGAVGDGTADDTAAILAAQAAIPATGGTLYFPKGDYRTTAVIPIKTKVAYVGDGYGSRVFTTTAINALFELTGATDVTDVTFEKLRFTSNAIDPGTYPRHARAVTGSGALNAVKIVAFQANATKPRFTNFTMRECFVENFSSLPIAVFGVEGYARLHDSFFLNNLDIGFIHCDSVSVTGNVIQKSGDNGVSVSRVNRYCVIDGNVMTNCADSGVWVSGFVGLDVDGNNVSEVGPATFSVSGNSIFNQGLNGIAVQDAPKWGAIVGNTIDTVLRGPVNIPSDSAGYGIYLSGLPQSAPSAPTSFGQGLLVANNVIRNAARFGVIARGVKNVKISGNLMEDIGSQFKADGTTPVGPDEVSQNVGVYINNGQTTTAVSVTDNQIVDLRGTPYTNYGVQTDPFLGPLVSFVRRGNREVGLRNSGGDFTLAYPRSAETEPVAQIRQALTSMGLVADATSAAAPIVNDTMTDAAATTLQTHTGETGATWTKHGSATSDAQITDVNRVRNVTSGSTALYYPSAVPATVDYDVAADFFVKSVGVTLNTGICIRMDTAANTMYVFRYNSTTVAWELLKLVAGAPTTLKSFAQTLIAGTTYAVRARSRDAAKKLWVAGADGVYEERISSTDNTITAKGVGGLRLSDSTPSNTAGIHVDNFRVIDY